MLGLSGVVLDWGRLHGYQELVLGFVFSLTMSLFVIMITTRIFMQEKLFREIVAVINLCPVVRIK